MPKWTNNCAVRKGFIEELGQDAAAPAPPRPEAPFPANDQFDQLGQVWTI